MTSGSYQSSAMDYYKAINKFLDTLPAKDQLFVEISSASAEQKKVLTRIKDTGDSIRARSQKTPSHCANAKSRLVHDDLFEDEDNDDGSDDSSTASELLDLSDGRSSESRGSVEAAIVPSPVLVEDTRASSTCSSVLRISTKKQRRARRDTIATICKLAKDFRDNGQLAQYATAVLEGGFLMNHPEDIWSPSHPLTAPRAHHPHYIWDLPKISRELNNNSKSDRIGKIRWRVALAHFSEAYQDAKKDRQAFMAYAQECLRSLGATPEYGPCCDDAHVKRLLDKIMTHTIGGDTTQTKCRIHDWHNIGQRWAKLIRRLGYGILLLKTGTLTDNRFGRMPLRLAWHLVDALKARQSCFGRALHEANSIMAKMFDLAASAAVASIETYSFP